MSKVKIRNLDVHFPYEKPYDIQVEYMNKVIDCLENKRHGVLESPTGTGKTLCLLAPVTSWLRSRKLKLAYSDLTDPNIDNSNIYTGRKRDKVWYTARTHSQIAQTVSEVRRCDIDGLAVRVMGARDQLCVHPQVSQEKERYVKTVMCKELVKTRSCRFHREIDYEKHAPVFYRGGDVLDIEDLVSAGRKMGVCPYYMAKQAKDHADVVLLPYNYIIDRDSRDLGLIPFFNNIVIFDEGHNVPQTCEESYEFSLTSADIAQGISRTQELMNALIKMRDTGSTEEDDVDWARHAENSFRLIEVLKGLETGLETMPVSTQLFPMISLLQFLEKAGVHGDSAKNLLGAMEGFKTDSIRLQLSKEVLSTFQLIERMLQVLFGAAIRTFSSDVVERSFKYVVTDDLNHINNSKKLSLFCFNPSFGIQDVLMLGIETMIITSGTLSPLPSFIQELGLPSPITLENGHIASSSQVPFMILGTGVNNVKMDASFRNRKEPAYMYSLGMTLTNLISSVPDGVLLLFSSYSMMQSLKDHWEKESGIWKRLDSIKRVFVEPRGKEEFLNCMENYRRAIDAGNGAILMGVLRGKISEGMDFKNQYCRAVFVIGVPFPPIKDLRVVGKEKYAESLMTENPKTGKLERLYESYLSVEAMKATNQAIGRVIRHGEDYGAIILVDYRFVWPKLFNNISGWLRGPSATEANFMTAKKRLREFFNGLHAGKIGVPTVRRQRINANGDPIAGHVEFDVYDHKTAQRQRVAIGSISTASGRDSRRYTASKNYDDSVDSGCDLMAKYRDYSSSPSSSTPVKSEPNSSSPSIFETMDCSPSTRIEYRPVDLSRILQPSEDQKRKLDLDDSSTSQAKGKKLNRRRIVTNFAFYNSEPKANQSQSYQNKDPEPMSIDLKDRKVKLINYFEKAKRILPVADAIKFKEVSRTYMKGEIELSSVIPVLRKIFKSEDTSHLLKEFEICIKTEDTLIWKNLVSS